MGTQAVGTIPEVATRNVNDGAEVQVLRKELRERNIEAFNAWLRLVNGHVVRFTGLALDDLPDYDYASAYDEGRNARTVARQAIRAAGGF